MFEGISMTKVYKEGRLLTVVKDEVHNLAIAEIFTEDDFKDPVGIRIKKEYLTVEELKAVNHAAMKHHLFEIKCQILKN